MSVDAVNFGADKEAVHKWPQATWIDKQEFF